MTFLPPRPEPIGHFPEAQARIGEESWFMGVSPAKLFLAVLFLATVFVVATARWPLQGEVVPWDSKLQFYPFFRFLGESFKAGVLPFWNPYHYAGHPSIADPQSLVFNPIFMALAAVWPDAPMLWFDVAVGLHLLIGGIAILMLSRRWGFGLAGGVLAALIFMYGGSAAGRLQHTGQIISYSWLAVALWLLDGALERRSLSRAIGFGLVAGLMAVGRDQVAYLGAIVLVAYAVGKTFLRADALSFFWTRLPVLMLMALVGLLVIALPMALTMQLATLSNRPAFEYKDVVPASLYPVNFANLLAPNLFGSLSVPYDYWGPGYATRPWVDATDRAINYVFLGTVPVALLLIVGLAGQKLLSWRFLAPSLITLFAVLYALGAFSPLFPLMFQHVPGVDLYRRPADATFLFNIGMALLAGGMLGRFVEAGPPKPTVMGTGLAILALGAAVGFALWFSTRLDKVAITGLYLAIGVAIIVVAAILMFATRSAAMRSTVAALAILATAGELLWFNQASAINAEPRAFYSVYDKPMVDEAKTIAILQQELAARHEKGEFPRVEMLGLGGAWQNASMVLGIENTLGYNPLRIASSDTLFRPGQNSHIVELRAFPPTFPGYDSDLARRLGIEYLVLGKTMADLPALFPRPAEATLLLDGPQAWIYRLPPALPRVALASSVVFGDSAANTALGLYAAGASPDRVQLEQGVKLASQYRSAADALPVAGMAKIIRYSPTLIEIEAETREPSILVLHDPFYPGWFASVNGQDRPILLANQMFRGIELPAGKSKVVFRYAPLSLANARAALDAFLDPGPTPGVVPLPSLAPSLSGFDP
jgi:hypothetical protein